MIFQTKASILTALLELDGGYSVQVKASLKDKVLTRKMGHEIEMKGDVSNDRTRLKAHKKHDL